MDLQVLQMFYGIIQHARSSSKEIPNRHFKPKVYIDVTDPSLIENPSLFKFIKWDYGRPDRIVNGP